MSSNPETKDAYVSNLSHAIQTECAPTDQEHAACIGFVVISEWVDLEGNTTLTKVFADPRGTIPSQWRVMGWLEFALRKFT